MQRVNTILHDYTSGVYVSDIIFSFAMNSTENNCNCADCCFVKDELLPKMIYGHFLPIEPSFVIDFIFTTHTRLNAIFTPYSVLYASTYLHRESEKCHIALIIKMLNNRNSPEEQDFNNEMEFYKNESFKTRDLFPKCYFANIFNESFQRPVIVFEDFTNGYIKLTTKLNNGMLFNYIITLARFHAETFRMQENEPDNFQCILQNMRFENENKIQVKQQKAVSAFLNSSEMDNLSLDVREKIIRKLYKVKHLQMCTLFTIIQGSFTRDAVALKIYDTNYGKIIDFKRVQYGPPVIDFGRLLLTNLPNTPTILDLQTFCLNAMSIYVRSLTENYPEMAMYIKLLEQEIYNNLLFSYINLENDERQAIPQPEWILDLLNQFCEY